MLKIVVAMFEILLAIALIVGAPTIAWAQGNPPDSIDQLLLQRREAASLARNEQDISRIEKELAVLRSRLVLAANDSNRVTLKAEESRLQLELAALLEKVRLSTAALERSRRTGSDQGPPLAAGTSGFDAAAAAPGPPTVVSPFVGMNDRSVCRGALATAGKGWSAEPGTREHRAVAEQRGYSATTCEILLASPPPAPPPTPPEPSISFETLCKIAMGDQPRGWSRRPEDAAHVALAVKQGYTPDMCARLVAAAAEYARERSRLR